MLSFSGVAGRPGAVLDHPGHGVPIQRFQLRPPHQGSDEPRVAQRAVLVAVDPRVEIRRDPEQVGELGIVVHEQVVDQRFSEHHDLDPERDRFRLERGRRRPAEGLRRRLDLDEPGAQRPLQRVPGERLGEDLPRVQDQASAVGPMQGPGLDQHEVGDQRSHLRHALDASHQVGLGRMILVDQRRALRRPAGMSPGEVPLVPIHHDVDLIAARRRGSTHLSQSSQPHHHLRLLLRLGEEVVGVLDHVVPHGLQMLQDHRLIGPGFLQLFDGVPDGVQRDFAIEISDLFALLLLPCRNLAQQRLQVLLQLLRRDPAALAVVFRQLLEILRSQHLAILDGRQRQSHRRPDQGDVLRLAALLQFVEGFFVAFLEVFLNDADAIAVFLALEGRRDGHAQFLHQARHVVVEGTTLAGRQAHRPRTVGFGEIVDVAPVGRRLPPAYRLLQASPDQRVLAGARRPQREQVVAAVRHPDGEADGLGGAVLAEHFGGGFQVVRRFERQPGGVARAEQKLGRQRRRRGRFPVVRHASSSIRSMSSSLKPKWWPISWISTCRTMRVSESPVSHQKSRMGRR